MVDLSRPVGWEVIVASIGFIALCVAAGLLAVAYYKRKRHQEEETS